MKTNDYIIAAHRIRIGGERLLDIVEKIDGFRPFLAETEGEPLVTITSEGTENMPVPPMVQTQYVFTFEDIESQFGTTADGYLFRMLPSEGEPLELWGARDGQTLYIKGHLNGPMTLRLVRFALWIAYGLATVGHDTIAIHTSTITYRGKAVIFLGESGTGKSTHTRLWREHIEGAVLLNDDSPMLRLIDGRPWMFGSPWSGKTPCYKNEKYPLAGCVRLSQAPSNHIRKLSRLEAYGAIHPSCPPEFAYDEHLYDGISRTLSTLLQQVPFYHLACLPDAEAAFLSCKTVMNEE